MYDDGTVVSYTYDRAGNRLSRTVSEDRDGDGVPFIGARVACAAGVTSGCDDNCPGVANPDQQDRGGGGGGSAPDGIGDACQCGDVSGDGRVTLADAVLIRRSLLSPPAATMQQPGLCDVGGNVGCSIGDAVIVQRALLNPPSATISTRCGGGAP